MILTLVMTAAACGNKKKTGARFEDRGARATSATPRQVQNVGVTTVVYGIDQYGQYRDHNNWMSSVRRLVSASISEEYLGDVSQDGANKTGVFFGAKLCMNRYSSQSVPNQAMVVMQVYDNHDVPVPLYLNAVQGVYNASTGDLDVTFRDNYGLIRLVGRASGSSFSGWVQFDNKVRADGTADTYGLETLGAVYMNADQLFSCY